MVDGRVDARVTARSLGDVRVFARGTVSPLHAAGIAIVRHADDVAIVELAATPARVVGVAAGGYGDVSAAVAVDATPTSVLATIAASAVRSPGNAMETSQRNWWRPGRQR